MGDELVYLVFRRGLSMDQCAEFVVERQIRHEKIIDQTTGRVILGGDVLKNR